MHPQLADTVVDLSERTDHHLAPAPGPVSSPAFWALGGSEPPGDDLAPAPGPASSPAFWALGNHPSSCYRSWRITVLRCFFDEWEVSNQIPNSSDASSDDDAFESDF
eukprot:8831877-Karenia_brevis.AAC.1